MERLVAQLSDDKLLEYTEWKRVKECGKMKTRRVKINKSKTEFAELMLQEYQEFLKHIRRVKLQYLALRELKMNLPDTDLIIQMDFAKNFTCSAMDEIQSAYFDATAVTLHPIVLYFKNELSEIDHKNFIFVSDINHQNASAVLAIYIHLCLMLRPCFQQQKGYTSGQTAPHPSTVTNTCFKRLQNLKSYMAPRPSGITCRRATGKAPVTD